MAKPIPGRKRKISIEEISANVEKYPDDYQYERAERFGVSTHAVLMHCIQKRSPVKKEIKAP